MQLEREGSPPPGLRRPQTKMSPQFQPDSSRTDSPVRVRHAQPRSRSRWMCGCPASRRAGLKDERGAAPRRLRLARRIPAAGRAAQRIRRCLGQATRTAGQAQREACSQAARTSGSPHRRSRIAATHRAREYRIRTLATEPDERCAGYRLNSERNNPTRVPLARRCAELHAHEY
jgi:hypothetical protein